MEEPIYTIADVKREVLKAEQEITRTILALERRYGVKITNISMDVLGVGLMGDRFLQVNLTTEV